MHQRHLVGALHSGKVQEAGALLGLSSFGVEAEMALMKLVESLQGHNVKLLACFTLFMCKY